MSVKLKKGRFEPDVYVEPGTYNLDATDAFDMDVRAAANQIALKGDPGAAVEYLNFAVGINTTEPVKIPMVTFAKAKCDNKEVSENNHAMINALTASGWKIV